MSAIHFKFSSSNQYQTITFDGMDMSLLELKKSIMEKLKLKPSEDALNLTNAHSLKVYKEDDTLIPKNTMILVRRVPPGLARNAGKIYVVNKSESSKASKAAKSYTKGIQEFEKNLKNPIQELTKTSISSNPNATEQDKISAAIAQSSVRYDAPSYQKGRGHGAYRGNENVRCFRCYQTGHYSPQCHLPKVSKSDGERTKAPKIPTGIPRSQMVEVSKDEKGAMLAADGRYVVPRMDKKGYDIGKKERPPFIQDAPTPDVNDEDEEIPIPGELTCLICDDLLVDAVVINCCGNSFCDDCIRNALLDSESHTCPECKSANVSPDSLVANKMIRQAVSRFRSGTGITKKKSSRPVWPRPVNVEPVVAPVANKPIKITYGMSKPSDVRQAGGGSSYVVKAPTNDQIASSYGSTAAKSAVAAVSKSSDNKLTQSPTRNTKEKICIKIAPPKSEVAETAVTTSTSSSSASATTTSSTQEEEERQMKEKEEEERIMEESVTGSPTDDKTPEADTSTATVAASNNGENYTLNSTPDTEDDKCIDVVEPLPPGISPPGKVVRPLLDDDDDEDFDEDFDDDDDDDDDEDDDSLLGENQEEVNRKKLSDIKPLMESPIITDNNGDAEKKSDSIVAAEERLDREKSRRARSRERRDERERRDYRSGRDHRRDYHHRDHHHRSRENPGRNIESISNKRPFNSPHYDDESEAEQQRMSSMFNRNHSPGDSRSNRHMRRRGESPPRYEGRHRLPHSSHVSNMLQQANNNQGQSLLGDPPIMDHLIPPGTSTPCGAGSSFSNKSAPVVQPNPLMPPGLMTQHLLRPPVSQLNNYSAIIPQGVPLPIPSAASAASIYSQPPPPFPILQTAGMQVDFSKPPPGYPPINSVPPPQLMQPLPQAPIENPLSNILDRRLYPRRRSASPSKWRRGGGGRSFSRSPNRRRNARPSNKTKVDIMSEEFTEKCGRSSHHSRNRSSHRSNKRRMRSRSYSSGRSYSSDRSKSFASSVTHSTRSSRSRSSHRRSTASMSKSRSRTPTKRQRNSRRDGATSTSAKNQRNKTTSSRKRSLSMSSRSRSPRDQQRSRGGQSRDRRRKDGRKSSRTPSKRNRRRNSRSASPGSRNATHYRHSSRQSPYAAASRKQHSSSRRSTSRSRHNQQGFLRAVAAAGSKKHLLSTSAAAYNPMISAPTAAAITGISTVLSNDGNNPAAMQPDAALYNVFKSHYERKWLEKGIMPPSPYNKFVMQPHDSHSPSPPGTTTRLIPSPGVLRKDAAWTGGELYDQAGALSLDPARDIQQDIISSELYYNGVQETLRNLVTTQGQKAGAPFYSRNNQAYNATGGITTTTSSQRPPYRAAVGRGAGFYDNIRQLATKPPAWEDQADREYHKRNGISEDCGDATPVRDERTFVNDEYPVVSSRSAGGSHNERDDRRSGKSSRDKRRTSRGRTEAAAASGSSSSSRNKKDRSSLERKKESKKSEKTSSSKANNNDHHKSDQSSKRSKGDRSTKSSKSAAVTSDKTASDQRTVKYKSSSTNNNSSTTSKKESQSRRDKHSTENSSSSKPKQTEKLSESKKSSSKESRTRSDKKDSRSDRKDSAKSSSKTSSKESSSKSAKDHRGSGESHSKKSSSSNTEKRSSKVEATKEKIVSDRKRERSCEKIEVDEKPMVEATEVSKEPPPPACSPQQEDNEEEKMEIDSPKITNKEPSFDEDDIQKVDGTKIKKRADADTQQDAPADDKDEKSKTGQDLTPEEEEETAPNVESPPRTSSKSKLAVTAPPAVAATDNPPRKKASKTKEAVKMKKMRSVKVKETIRSQPEPRFRVDLPKSRWDNSDEDEDNLARPSSVITFNKDNSNIARKISVDQAPAVAKKEKKKKRKKQQQQEGGSTKMRKVKIKQRKPKVAAAIGSNETTTTSPTSDVENLTISKPHNIKKQRTVVTKKKSATAAGVKRKSVDQPPPPDARLVIEYRRRNSSNNNDDDDEKEINHPKRRRVSLEVNSQPQRQHNRKQQRSGEGSSSRGDDEDYSSADPPQQQQQQGYYGDETEEDDVTSTPIEDTEVVAKTKAEKKAAKKLKKKKKKHKKHKRNKQAAQQQPAPPSPPPPAQQEDDKLDDHDEVSLDYDDFSDDVISDLVKHENHHHGNDGDGNHHHRRRKSSSKHPKQNKSSKRRRSPSRDVESDVSEPPPPPNNKSSRKYTAPVSMANKSSQPSRSRHHADRDQHRLLDGGKQQRSKVEHSGNNGGGRKSRRVVYDVRAGKTAGGYQENNRSSRRHRSRS